MKKYMEEQKLINFRDELVTNFFTLNYSINLQFLSIREELRRGERGRGEVEENYKERGEGEKEMRTGEVRRRRGEEEENYKERGEGEKN